MNTQLSKRRKVGKHKLGLKNSKFSENIKHSWLHISILLLIFLIINMDSSWVQYQRYLKKTWNIENSKGQKHRYFYHLNKYKNCVIWEVSKKSSHQKTWIEADGQKMPTKDKGVVNFSCYQPPSRRFVHHKLAEYS